MGKKRALRASLELPNELDGESDRASAVVCGAWIEESLEILVRRRLVQDAADPLFGGAYGPLTTFAAKIDIARALGLISQTEAEDMHQVRKIRNAFSHSLAPLVYGEAPVVDHIKNMRHRGSAITGKPCKPRSDFEAGVVLLAAYLQGRVRQVSHLPARGERDETNG